MSQLDEEKKFYERFHCLVGDRQLMQVFEHYGYPAFRRSSVLEGFENFIKENAFRGDVCLEVGSLKGLTAIVLARYFKKVVTIDINDDPQKYQIAKLLGVTNIDFVNVLDNEAKAGVCAQLDFDAAYMDGDHAKDSPLDFKILKRCGRVLAHEFWDSQPVVEQTLRAAGGKLVTKDKWALWMS